MLKYKIIFVLLAVMVISTSIFGAILEEKTLESLNPGDITINKNQEVCKEYEFTLNSIDEKSKAYFQLIIKNYIKVKEGLEIRVYLNDVFLEEIKNNSIDKKNIIELKNVKTNNQIEICVKNDFFPRILIDSESILGNYYVAEIKENDFYQEAPSYGYVNTMIPINLYVNNSGYDDLEIEVINATDKFIYNSNLENVSGDTSFKGVLKAQEKIMLSYFVKTDLNISFATPLAKLKYIDRFGKEHIVNLQPNIINIVERENQIKATIDLFKIIEPNKKFGGNLIIINQGEDTLKDVYIKSNFLGDITLNKNHIVEIKPKDVVEIPFTIKTYKEDSYNLTFNINYLTKEKESIYLTDNFEIISKNKDTAHNTATTILIIITIMLFIWIVKI